MEKIILAENVTKGNHAVLFCEEANIVAAIILCESVDITEKVIRACMEHHQSDSVKFDFEGELILDPIDTLNFTVKVTEDDGEITSQDFSLCIAATY